MMQQLRAVVLTALVSAPLLSMGQASFPVVASGSFPIKADYWRRTSSDGSYIFATSKKDACVVDATTGKTLWTKNFKELTGVTKIKDFQILGAPKLLLMSTSERGADEILCLDILTGATKWTNQEYDKLDASDFDYDENTGLLYAFTKQGMTFVDVNTGKSKATLPLPEGKWQMTRALNPGDGTLILLLSRINLGALVSKGGWLNKIICLDIRSLGTKWSKEITNTFPIKYFNTATFSTDITSTSGVAVGTGSYRYDVSLFVEGPRVYFVGKGIYVFDRATGNQLWQAPYTSFVGRGLMGGGKPTYGAIASPILDGKKLFVVNFDKENAIGRKYDKSLTCTNVETGSVIWETQLAADDKDLLMTNMKLVGDVLVVQKGGVVNVQREDSEGNRVSFWEYVEPFGVMGFDATTGRKLWETPNWKGLITNIVVIDGKVYACDAKKLYVLDPKTGNQIEGFDLGKNKVGKPNSVQVKGDKIFVMSEEGIAFYDKAGNLLGTFSDGKDDLKKSEYSVEMSGNFFIVYGKDEVTFFNATTLAKLGTYKYLKDTNYKVGDDVSYLMVHDEKGFKRHRIQ